MPVYTTEFVVPADLNSMLEDRGESAICDPSEEKEIGGDGHFFVVIRSHQEGARRDSKDSHPIFRSLLGKKVRVTVELIED